MSSNALAFGLSPLPCLLNRVFSVASHFFVPTPVGASCLSSTHGRASSIDSKITANTYTGKSGVINVEREVELSGSTHSKGVFILSGYLGEMFAQDIPLCLTASICFEQLYNGVDGDSASSTELYGLLSSLSGIPINQSIANPVQEQPKK